MKQQPRCHGGCPALQHQHQHQHHEERDDYILVTFRIPERLYPLISGEDQSQEATYHMTRSLCNNLSDSSVKVLVFHSVVPVLLVKSRCFINVWGRESSSVQSRES